MGAIATAGTTAAASVQQQASTTPNGDAATLAGVLGAFTLAIFILIVVGLAAVASVSSSRRWEDNAWD